MNRTEHHLVAFVIFLSLITLPSIVVPSQLSVPQQYRTIQSAINASRIGDTVLVDHGIYFENILINKNITLTSRFIVDKDTSHISNTIIDGSKPKNAAQASVVTIFNGTDTSCVLIGFTITGGSGTGTYWPDDPPGFQYWKSAAGVRIVESGARIAHNIIRNNHLTKSAQWNCVGGAALATINTNYLPNLPLLIVEENIIEDNTVTGFHAESGGISIFQRAIIRRNIITRNISRGQQRAVGGGVSVGNFTDVLIDGNFIHNNNAGIGAGIVVVKVPRKSGRTIITNNIISDNRAEEGGGGLYCYANAYTVIANNTIVGNRARSFGGGIDLGQSISDLFNNIIWNNTPDQITTNGNKRVTNNLIQGGFPGRNNFHRNPGFLSGDSLFRLSPRSPCIGIAIDSFWLFREIFISPRTDFFGSDRTNHSGGHADIGAIESIENRSDEAEELLKEFKIQNSQFVKLTFLLRQISQKVYDVDSFHILRGGKIVTTIVMNDDNIFHADSLQMITPITLPPGDNFLEIELKMKPLSRQGGFYTNYWLMGADQKFEFITVENDRRYLSYTGLKPGSYSFVIQPADEDKYRERGNIVSIPITVLPYWYQQWWAYVLYGLTIILCTVFLSSIRNKRILMEHNVKTTQIQAAKLEELDKLKSRFFANVTHELRTPLSLILGPVEFLLHLRKDSEGLEQLGLIHRNAQRLMRLIELLLQYSRLESGTIKLRVAQLEIVSLLRRITGYFSSPAAKKQIDIRFVAEQEQLTGWIDAEKVEHILQNCISNAIKFTQAGGIIEVCVKEEKGDLVLFIGDTGEGIAPEHLQHVFDRFYRVDTTHKTEGTGIGLSLSKELAEIHHGSISLESELGKGTVVTVRIPLSGYDVSEIESNNINDASKEKQHYGSSYQVSSEIPVSTDEQPLILIAEDSEDARIFIRSQLSPYYNIIEAIDGDEALQKTKFQIPDLVISDVMMPKKDGRELCSDLKHDERTSHIPIILLTALAEKVDKIKGLKTGADDYLVKPFDAQELLTRVHNLLENRKILREAYGKAVPLKPGEIAAVSLDDIFLQKSTAIVTAHISEPEFDIETFAHEIFLSRTQLQRKLKAITNMAPSDFLRHLRLQRAKELLEKNSGTIAEIADAVGFNNHSYFAKCFQEQFGLPPNQFRNHQK